MIRVLIDMNLAPRWAKELGARGIDSVHWSSIGAHDADDRDLFAWAASNARVILTCDLDFTRLLALSAATGPSVVLLRARDTSVGSFGGRVAAILQEHADVLARGALIVVDETASRIQILPLRAKILGPKGT